MKNEVLARGCLLVNYMANPNGRDDLCLIKEHLLLADGTVVPNSRLVKNPKRSWWLTIKEKQNHQEKKEWERKRYLREYKVNQAQLAKQMAMVLGTQPKGLRQLNQSPYVYGTDITIQSCIKNQYDKQMKAYNETAEKEGKPKLLLIPKVGYADFEWDIKTKHASIGSYVFEVNATLTLREDIYKPIPNYKEKIEDLFYNTYLPWLKKEYYDKLNLKAYIKVRAKELKLEDIDQDDKTVLTKEFISKTDEEIKAYLISKEQEYKATPNYKLNIILSASPIYVLKDLYHQAHKDQPDYLAFWNGSADMETTFSNCEYFGVNPGDLLCSPDKRIPDEYRHSGWGFLPHEKRNYNWQPSPAEKLDANGNPKRMDLDQRWNILENLAAWQYIDLMCLYSDNRRHLPNKPSYGLDFTLMNELGIGKFKFKGLDPKLDEMDDAAWHQYMVAHYPIEYAIYAVGDVIPMQILDSVTSEVMGQLYPKLGVSPLKNYNKSPRRNADRFHFSLLDKGYVMGSTSNDMFVEVDNNVYTADSWIVTLNSTLHTGMGANCLEGLPNTPTLFIPKVGDGDIKSSYPSSQRYLNISKTTTYGELFKIDGVKEIDARRIGLNISSGKGSAYNVCHEVLKYPHVSEWVKLYRSEKVS